MPKTFDPGTFDIHESDEIGPVVYPTSENEKIDPRTLQGISQEAGTKKPKKHVFAAVVGNVLLPGLGNVIIKRTLGGSILLLLNIIFLAAALSPFSALGFLGNMAYPEMPPALGYALFGVGGDVNTGTLIHGISAMSYLAISVAFVTWLHFFYLLTKSK